VVLQEEHDRQRVTLTFELCIWKIFKHTCLPVAEIFL